jgi:CRISPR-associated endonuclease/helicase Cas3
MSALPPLAVAEFADAFAAIHGHPPYTWQLRLLREVAERRTWPEAIAAPTGAGKTAVLDVALFHLALCAGEPARAAPIRIVLAVDRRIIVDQAFERATRIRDALTAAEGRVDVLGRMAGRLAGLSGTDPLHVAELRGGIPRESDWARQPDQPTVLCTTVDQLGSRLLFRGYGVSTGMAPIHAGLLGTDALVILDEAHLSAAFADTLASFGRRLSAGTTLSLPWNWTQLTATPRDAGAAGVFRLMGEERGQQAIHRRLAASKPAGLVKVDAEETTQLAEAFVRHAQTTLARCLADAVTAPVIGIVVNRVALARAVFDHLTAEIGTEAILLTGRVRPAERDALIGRYRDRLEGKGGGNSDVPLFVVATQCIEAGADFDFDGLVTQIAPLDALRQRFGRLARSGNRNDKPAPGLILAAKPDIAKKADDPVYGDRMRQTWDCLTANALPADRKDLPVIDFGPDALDAMIAAEAPDAVLKVADCAMAALPAPLLRQADIDFFAMTSPRPSPDPEPSLFLHGEFRPVTDVSVVWRADLEELFRLARVPELTAYKAADVARRLTAIVDILPPRAGEALNLPVWRVRQWLSGTRPPAGTDPLADIEAAIPSDVSSVNSSAKRVLRWRGLSSDTPELIEPDALRPGDLVILPSSDGGCDAFGWAPESTQTVTDIAELAARPYASRRAALRLHPALLAQHQGAPVWTEANDIIAGLPARQVAARLGELVPELPLKVRECWQDSPSLLLLTPYDEDEAAGLILLAPKGIGGAAGDTAEPATEGDLGSAGTQVEPLAKHTASVMAFARAHAERLWLTPVLAASLVAAACWHDIGKADPRFQSFLRSLGRLANTGEPWAKSGRIASPAEMVSAREQSGLPKHWRHEVQSVRLAAARLVAEPALGEGLDPDLVLWLIGTHHGQGRPFFAHDDDWDNHDDVLLGEPLPASPGPDKLDFSWDGLDWAGMMTRLHGRYGVWGLAFLESVLRLADHRASAAGGR